MDFEETVVSASAAPASAVSPEAAPALADMIKEAVREGVKEAVAEVAEARRAETEAVAVLVVEEEAPAAPVAETTASVGTSSRFQGVSGAVSVSIVAFSIVFGVLLILTGMIFAMKLFAGGDKPKDAGGKPSGGATARAAAPAPAAPAAVASPSKIVAAITAAILAATGGRGRVLSISPSGPAIGGAFSAWRTSGVVALVNNSLRRPWAR